MFRLYDRVKYCQSRELSALIPLPILLYTSNFGCVRRLGGKPARAEAAGDAAAKKRACKLFLP
ncbi:MAG TPA: hypothetical protein GXZ40_04105, partial [Bacteroidales bacterium]|nr:hypothetical protein [Bacteroidales bacterium]